MTTKEIKLMIIENYIDHVCKDQSEGQIQAIKDEASQYVDEDHVDEIAQAGYGDCQEYIDLLKFYGDSSVIEE